MSCRRFSLNPRTGEKSHHHHHHFSVWVGSDGSGMKMSLLTQDNYQEKLATVEAMSGLHMCQWRAGQVLAWLEISLGMPMYGRNCALNIKSGKVTTPQR